MIVKDLNDSQDPKHMLFCRKNAFVAIYAFFSDIKCALFARWEEGSPKGHNVTFYYYFFISGLPLGEIFTEKYFSSDIFLGDLDGVETIFLPKPFIKFC